MVEKPSVATAVYTESEFSLLRTVVLAQSEFRAPDDLQDADPALGFLDGSDRESVLAMRGKTLAEAFPARQEAWERERDALKSVLQRHGIEVVRPRLMTEVEKAAAGTAGYSNFFVRDPWFTVGGNVIEGCPRFRHRRLEVLPSRPVLKERALGSDAAYVALPAPELPDPEGTDGPGPFLEGGDVLVFGKHVFVGRSGLASDDAGHRWLSEYLRPQGYTVEQVPLQPHVLHLDCALGLVREGLLLVCEERLTEGVPGALADWDRVAVSEEEARALGTNGLPISPDAYITDPAFRRIGDELTRRGITVEYVDFTVSRSLGGSFRCSTQPLARFA
ncbi:MULTISPECIES: dimethylarginine dimethylaminohydrolase family protein [Streptomyces]|uniref:dimethylarginine dimethylaminohydrolase family protein n=1 Tax=Streptomyces TaxID=1883 RepID=UPI003801CB3A